MKNEETICYKVSECIKEIEDTVNSGKFNAGKVAHLLHEIRKDAQQMENALKLRKEILVKHNLEEEYQKDKKSANTLEGINTIANKEEFTSDKFLFEFTVKENGVLVYQNKCHAGVISIVEEIEDMDEFGEIDGRTQNFHFGHPIALWFAFDQLKQQMEARGVQIMTAIKQIISDKKYLNPEVRKQFISSINNTFK